MFDGLRFVDYANTDSIYVKPPESATELDYPTRSLEGYTCVGNLRSFINSIEETTYGSLEADQVAYLGIALKMRESAGNEYQGLSLCGTFDIRVLATQYSSEYDSFGNQYDKDATYDIQDMVVEDEDLKDFDVEFILLINASSASETFNPNAMSANSLACVKTSSEK